MGKPTHVRAVIHDEATRNDGVFPRRTERVPRKELASSNSEPGHARVRPGQAREYAEAQFLACGVRRGEWLLLGARQGRRGREQGLRALLRSRHAALRRRHCDGSFDAFAALVGWVESGDFPDRIVAAVNPANPALDDLTPAVPPNRTRPLCPYPKYARYVGSGSIDDETNFVCVP